jgi:hypothetical protein
MFILVIAYNLIIPLFGIYRNYKRWVKIWIYAFLISIFQIFPDWFLSSELNILVFPNDGLFKIGPVSGYMMGLWAIPLFIIMYIGVFFNENYLKKYALLVTSILSLLIFAISEMTIWIIGSWYPQNVIVIFGHLALYILIPEVILGVSSFLSFNYIEYKAWYHKIIMAFLIMLLYLGSASFFYLLIEKILFI